MDLIILILILGIQSTMIVCCLMVYKEVIKRFENKWLYYVVLLLPMVNILMTILLLDTIIVSYKRSYSEKRQEVIDREDTINTLKRNYVDLERKKFRKVRLGDKFMVPKSDSWVDGFRGKECVIIEINYDSIIAKAKDDKVNRWSVKFEHLQHMIFLSNEPIKPFELIGK